MPNGASRIGIGSVLSGRYELLEEIKRDGMSTMYKALNRFAAEAHECNPYIALNVLNEDFIKSHPKAFTALQRAAARQKRLRHPNIVGGARLERDGRLNVHFMIMEPLEGMPLTKFIDERRQRYEGGLSFAETWLLVKSLGDGQQYMHDAGFVHSDFNASNVFVGEDGTASMMGEVDRWWPRRDGEGARNDVGEESTRSWAETGTLSVPYSSMEMLRGEYPEPRDDLFALAIVTYQLLTLTHPFGKQGADEAFDARLVPKPVKGLSRRSRAALARALAFERRERQPDIAAFLQEFREQSRLRGWFSAVATLFRRPQ